jgi:hypothetical protein
MSYGSANSWPGTPVAVHDFTEGSALNGSSLRCTTFYESVVSVKDLTTNARIATQGTAANRARFLPAGNGYLLTPENFNSANDKNLISRGTYLDSALGFTLDAHIAPLDWTPAAINVIAEKGRYGSASGSDRAWTFQLNTTGNLVLGFWNSAAAVGTATSTVNLSALADNAETWVRAVYNPNTGSGNYSVEFYTSPDGVTWTQLGTTLTGVSHNINASSLEIGLGVSVNSNSNVTRMLGRYYQFRYYIAGVLTVDWRAEDSQHLHSWGPLNTGLGGFISYSNTSYLIKEDSIYVDSTDFYTYGSSFAPGTTWLAAMKAQVNVNTSGAFFMVPFSGTAGATPNLPKATSGAGSNGFVISGADSALSAATPATAAANPFQVLNSTGIFIADRTGAVITLQNNTHTTAPATTAPAGGSITQFLAAGSSGVITRSVFYGSTKPSDADLKDWLGPFPGRNMFRFSQDPEQLDSGDGWQHINITVTAKQVANPLDGKVNAALVALSGGNVAHFLYRTISTQAMAYCLSGYVRRPASLPNRYLALNMSDGVAVNSGMVFDTTTWTPSFTSAGVTGGAIDVGGGWYRLWISYTYPLAYGSANASFNFTTAGAIGSNVNANGEGLYIWGCQWHPGTTPDVYRPKTRLSSPFRNEV